MAFQNLIGAQNRRLEILQAVLRLRIQRDLDEDVEGEPQFVRIEPRPIALDDAAFLKQALTAMTGRGRKRDFVRDLLQAAPAVGLQRAQQFFINLVHAGKFSTKRKKIRCISGRIKDSSSYLSAFSID